MDFTFPTYREHGIAWCRGVPPENMLRLFRAVSNGGWDPQKYRHSVPTVVLGSQTLHAVGYAMGIQRDGAEEAAMAFFGDGASSQGDVLEAFVWAASFNAPVVFFCQNNQWGISTPSTVQSKIPLYHRAHGFGFPGRARRRQRRARGLRGHQARPGLGARRRRTDVDRGLHLPDRRAHDVGRPDALPHRRRGRGVEAPRPRRAREGAAWCASTR